MHCTIFFFKDDVINFNQKAYAINQKMLEKHKILTNLANTSCH